MTAASDSCSCCCCCFLYCLLLLLQTFWTTLNGFCTFPCSAATNQLISFYYYLVLLPKRGKNCWQRNVRQATRHKALLPAVVPFSMLISIIMMKMLIMIITVRLVQESAYKALSVAARRVNYFRWGCKFYLLYYAWSVLPPKECKEEADKEWEEGEGGGGNWQRRCCHEICIHFALNFDINCV